MHFITTFDVKVHSGLHNLGFAFVYYELDTFDFSHTHHIHSCDRDA